MTGYTKGMLVCWCSHTTRCMLHPRFFLECFSVYGSGIETQAHIGILFPAKPQYFVIFDGRQMADFRTSTLWISDGTYAFARVFDVFGVRQGFVTWGLRPDTWLSRN